MRIVCVLVQLWLKESKVFLVQKLSNLLPPSVWESLLRELCHCEANCHVQSVQHVKKNKKNIRPLATVQGGVSPMCKSQSPKPLRLPLV